MNRHLLAAYRGTESWSQPIKVSIQVIKVFDIEVDAADADEVIGKAYKLQTTEIESTGDLIDAMTDHAETID